MRNLIFIVLASTFFAVGCSHVDVKHVAFGDTSDGIHFYESKPYLLVTLNTTGGQNNYASSIVWFPDPDKEYVAKEVVLLGSVEESVTLNNGWQLAAFGAKADSKIPETITALTGVAKAAAGGAGMSAEGLYPIIFEGGMPTLGKKVKGW